MPRIGRSIWWDALKGFIDKSLSREDAAAQIADNYLRFVEVYEGPGGALKRHNVGCSERAEVGGRLGAMAMKMRQELSPSSSRSFCTEMDRDRNRRESLRARAALRSRKRSALREKKRSSVRYWLLVLSLIATAVGVTVAMFETLYYLLG